MSPPPKAVNRRIPELDGLRGIAILLVLMFHLTPAKVPLLAAYFIQAGWLGVDLFFVLSGYLITGILVDTAGRPGYYRNFILRRTLRIFPLYFACLAIACIRTYWPAYSPGHGFFETGGWWYAIYLGNVQVFLQNRWPLDLALLPLWSLQVEEQFYLTFPLLVASVTRRNLARILVAAVIAAPLFPHRHGVGRPNQHYGNLCAGALPHGRARTRSTRRPRPTRFGLVVGKPLDRARDRSLRRRHCHHLLAVRSHTVDHRHADRRVHRQRVLLPPEF